MSRRLVAVLFLDLVGWTSTAERVDPEVLQLLLEDYYELCSASVEENGGEVEKFIGDAVMAAFGAVTSQENDAARAVRTASRIQAGLAAGQEPGGLVPPLQLHAGIAAGEALVVRSPRAGLRIVGDVVNLAARLQTAAAAGEILVDETVADLAAPHFTLAPVAPLALKGKTEPVPAWRVLGPAEVDRLPDAPRLVDRVRERARLRDAYDRVVRDGRAEVVVLTGPLGIGKTRLVRELVDELGRGGRPPAVLVGECPTYGEHENLVALVEILETVAGRAATGGDDDRATAVVTGLGDRDGSGHAPGLEELTWAAQHLLSTAACAGPLVVIWDNLEWAGQTLLRIIGDLVEGLADLPVLTVCLARPELAERDVPWLTTLPADRVVHVGALGPADSLELAASLAAAGEVNGGIGAAVSAEVQAHGAGLVDRATVDSAGNPLFIRLLLASTTGRRTAEKVPPTVTAVVGAMIDRLPAAAQELLGAASVVGPVFTCEQLALVEHPAPARELQVLLDRQLIRTGDEPGEYCFVQRPVHEVAYARLDKQRRLTWHRDLAERDVSPEFHYEAAVRLLLDVRPHDAERVELTRRATDALVEEGTASLRQRDLATALELLERAHGLTRDTPGPHRSRAAIRLSDALLQSGDTGRARLVVAGIAEDPADPHRWPCVVQQQVLAVRTGTVPDVTAEQLLTDLETDRADPFAWCRFEQFRMLVHLAAGRFVAAERAAWAALAHAKAVEDGFEEDRLLVALCEIRQWSPTPLEKTLSGCEELERRFALDRFLLVPVLATKARCLALVGDRFGARATLAEASAAVDELHLTLGRALVAQAAGLACSLDGRPEEAQGHYLRAADAVERAGHVPAGLTMRVLAARERAHHDPDGAAADLAPLALRLPDMEVHGRLLCMSATARLAARDGTPAAAIAVVQVMLADTDDPCLRGDVCFDLAQANRSAGDHAAATAMAEAAVTSYATIGATRPIRRVQAWT